MSLELESKISALKKRALMLHQARHFFLDRGIVEVDCPLLSSGASIDLHIDLFTTEDPKRYLFSSPEHAMKRLIAAGMGDCYQLSHVYRKLEKGSRHNPEFMMAEWYRLNFSFQAIIEETLDFIRLFIGKEKATYITYQEALLKFANIDCLNPDEATLHQHLQGAGYTESADLDTSLNLIMSLVVEPQIASLGLVVISHFPISQAALARASSDPRFAERFEVYFHGIELANGYHELADAKEQRTRYEEANKERLRVGKDAYAIDEFFLKALENGFPDCCGVAVGFDRLMMLHLQKKQIRDVIPYSWDEI